MSRAAELAVRESYGRLIAYLSARSRNVAAAEDALSAAVQAALEEWPRRGVPEKPEAWLLAAARRRLMDGARHAEVQAEASLPLRLAAEEAEARASAEESFPDERLPLLFVCAHPAIDAVARTPLMLQVVLGLDAARIASAFLMAPSAMGQRLVRAKAKIRDAGIPFEMPERHHWPERAGAVLEAVYAAYGSGWDDVAGTDSRRKDLTEESLWLARLLVRLMPEDAEARGLLALLLHCEARRGARRAEDGRYIPLSEQDVGRWSRPLLEEAERELARAASLRRLGRFQLEAALQSVHAQRAVTGHTDWKALAGLYEGLVHLAPTIGALVGRAAALADARGIAEGLAALEALEPELVQSYQPYWATRGNLLSRAGRHAEARAAYTRAIGLSEDDAVRRFLQAELTSGVG